MRRPRHLSPDDRAVWDHVRQQVKPLHPQKRSKPAPVDTPAASPARKATPHPPLAPFDVGAKADIARPHDILPPLRDRLRSAPVAMDAKNFLRMKAGKLKP